MFRQLFFLSRECGCQYIELKCNVLNVLARGNVTVYDNNFTRKVYLDLSKL